LRKDLKKSNKVGVAKIIIRTKESLSLIIPHEHALFLYLIHFTDEIREEDEIKTTFEPQKLIEVFAENYFTHPSGCNYKSMAIFIG
jgi:DNA end-binding protein Ku